MGMRDGNEGVFYESFDYFSSSPKDQDDKLRSTGARSISENDPRLASEKRLSDTAPADSSSALPSSLPLPSTILPSTLAAAQANADNIFAQMSALPLSSSLASGLLYQQHFFSYALQHQMLLSALANQTSGAGSKDDASSEAPAPPKEPETTEAKANTEKKEMDTKPRIRESPVEETLDISVDTNKRSKTNGYILSSPLDNDYLNPIHCFVRRHVEFFAANEADVSAPAPGRKTRIRLGQVGLRCIHCKSLPPKKRVKRAFCFPKNVSGIYHAVSNMKFDHFGKCHGLPTDERAEFSRLRESCSRRGSTSTSSGGMANSTAQYYHDSSLRMGLEDTADGIRFRRSSESQESGTRLATSSEGSTPVGADGISALIIAASDPASDTDNST